MGCAESALRARYWRIFATAAKTVVSEPQWWYCYEAEGELERA